MKINRFLPIYIYIRIVPLKFGGDIQNQTKVRVRKPKNQYGCLAAILKLTLLKINRLLHIYISIVLLMFGVDIQSQSKVRSPETKKSNMAARQPFWKWRHWKSIGLCLWPPSTLIWNFKLNFQSKLDLCSGNHVVYRQTDGRTDGGTDKVNPVYPAPTSLGGGIITLIICVIFSTGINCVVCYEMLILTVYIWKREYLSKK